MAAPRILSICYEPVLQSLRAAVLQTHGYAVTCAASQKDALDMIARDAADCVVLGFTLSADEQMMFIRHAKQCSSKPPILAMSRNSEVVRLASAGIDPLEGPAQLLAAVAELLAAPAKEPKVRAKSRSAAGR